MTTTKDTGRKETVSNSTKIVMHFSNTCTHEDCVFCGKSQHNGTPVKEPTKNADGTTTHHGIFGVIEFWLNDDSATLVCWQCARYQGFTASAEDLVAIERRHVEHKDAAA